MNTPRYFRTLTLGILLTGGLAEAEEIQVRTKVPLGDLVYDDQETAILETVRLPKAFAEALSATGAEDQLALTAFPVAPGVRKEMVFEPFEVYAPEARITVLESGRDPYEIPRSRHRQFLGSSPDGTARAGLSFDPETGMVSGITMGILGTFELVANNPRDPSRVEVRNPTDLGDFLETGCGSDKVPMPLQVMEEASGVPASSLGATSSAHKGGGGTTYVVTIAIDTDNEFHHLRFDNDTTAAANWLASLFTAINVYYNRDVDLDLVQGETFFRLDTDPSPTYDDDPYENTDSPASSAALAEFRSFWSSNLGSVDRVFAALLSGKSSNNNSSSGIAYLDGYCEPTSSGGGYSVTQVFKFTEALVASGARLFAHEIGHNLGSPHTHCYNPPVDTCFALESGCHSGAVSCPAAGQGTVMSYCHFSNGANCGSSLDEFHPTVVALFDSFLAAHFPGCVESGAGEIFSDGFESGDTSAWDLVQE